MTYSIATELLGFTTPKSLKANAVLAESALSTISSKTFLKFKIAYNVLIKATK